MSDSLIVYDLLTKGFEVFTAASRVNTANLLVKKGSQIFTLETRTGYKHPNGNITYASQNKPVDYLAVAVHNTGQVFYVDVATKQIVECPGSLAANSLGVVGHCIPEVGT